MGFDTNKWFKRQYLMEAGLLENEEADKIHDLIYDANPSYSNLAKALSKFLKGTEEDLDSGFSSDQIKDFMKILHAELGMESLNEGETSDIETIDFEYTDNEGLFRKARVYYKDGSMDSFFGDQFNKFLKTLDITQEFDKDDNTDRDIIKSIKDKNIKVSFSERDVS